MSNQREKTHRSLVVDEAEAAIPDGNDSVVGGQEPGRHLCTVSLTVTYCGRGWDEGMSHTCSSSDTINDSFQAREGSRSGQASGFCRGTSIFRCRFDTRVILIKLLKMRKETQAISRVSYRLVSWV